MSDNSNTGHGHVFPRPDGVRARCGGPGVCAECSRDLARKNDELAAPTSKKLTRYTPHLNGTAFMGMLKQNETHPEMFGPDYDWTQGPYVLASEADAAIERLTHERDEARNASVPSIATVFSAVEAERNRLMRLLEIERGVVLTRGQALTRALRCFDELLDNVWPNGLPSTVDAVVEQMRHALENEKHSSDETNCIDDKDIRMFLGWLSVELPELHSIETPRLGRAWEKWRALMDTSSPPGTAPTVRDGGPAEAGHSSEKASEHRHTEECWEPASGCDMGRNEKYVSGPVAPGSESGANAKGAGGEKP